MIDLDSVEFYQPPTKADLAGERLLITSTCDAHAAEGVFIDAPKYKGQGVEVLASYPEPLGVESGEGTAAIVYCKVGEGAAVLTGPHPELVTFRFNARLDTDPY